MTHAAKNWGEAPSQHAAASLQLLQGSSTRASWVLEDAPGGTSISVGADPGCDWQIHAAGVPPHAISLLFLSGNVFVRSTCQGDARLNGSPLGDDWITAPDGARLDIGAARLGLSLCVEDSLFAPALASLSDDSGAAYGVTAAEYSVAAPTRLEYPARAETMPLTLERPRARSADERAVLKRHSRGFEPSLLGDDRPSLVGHARPSHSGLWFYVLVGVATLFAYAGWVLALDRF
jgi:hypothetical protein